MTRATRPVGGLCLAVLLWWALTAAVPDDPTLSRITPARTFVGVQELWGMSLFDDAASSIFRLLTGLVLATATGTLIGVAVGTSSAAEESSRPVLLFLRMVSPLSWAPVAVGVLGVGDPPVIALVAATAIWPVLAAASDGVRSVDPEHLLVARSFGADRWELWRSVTWPTLQPRLLGGIRASVGIAWVVLVPAEMLGVTSGLGYAVLNAKDQLAYHHITALILVIGTLGYVIDVLARWLLRTPRERAGERTVRATTGRVAVR
ncbi:ABC transporter permease [Austwickia chelonae]|uniref:ABC transporter permease n=1 Tax=Austwickia chelonae TaxID=100225 RepID=UPI001966FCEE|nr:ABC transporter permease [Austwickia chelonae]